MTQNKFILVFPGQGSQSVGMGKDLYSEFPEVKQTFEEASDALGFNMATLCFEDPENQLNLTQYTQSSILTLSTAIYRTLQKHKAMDITLVAGHSLGEYSALVSLGALKFSDAVKAVYFRGQAMQRAVPVGVGAMAAYLGSQTDLIPALCQEVSKPGNVVEVVNFNSLGQLVLSGHKEAVEKCCALISERKLGKGKILPVSAPFHSSLMQPAAQEMKEYLSKEILCPFEGTLIANVDAQMHTAKTYSKEFLIKQVAHPVLWTQTLFTMQAHTQQQSWSMIEVGPGKVLQGLVAKTLENVACTSTNSYAALKELL